MAENFTYSQGLIESIEVQSWFANPAGIEGKTVILLEKIGNHGSRYYCTLKPGQTLRLGERIFSKFSALVIDMKYGRTFPISGIFSTRDRSKKISVAANIRYHVTDPETLALRVADPLGELRDKIVAALNSDLAQYSERDINSKLTEKIIENIGTVPHLGLTIDNVEVVNLEHDSSEVARENRYISELQDMEHSINLAQKITSSNISPLIISKLLSLPTKDAFREIGALIEKSSPPQLNKILAEDYGEFQIEISSPTSIHLGIPSPSLITIETYVKFVNILASMDVIYMVLATLQLGHEDLVKEFLSIIKESDIRKSADMPLKLLEESKISSLQLFSVHYGSPVSFDILGIGTVLETLRDIIKDLVWRGKHEKDIADIEKEKAKIDTDSKKLDVELKRKELEKVGIENQRLALEVANQKLELVIKARNLTLTKIEKDLLINTIYPHLGLIAEGINKSIEESVAYTSQRLSKQNIELGSKPAHSKSDV